MRYRHTYIFTFTSSLLLLLLCHYHAWSQTTTEAADALSRVRALVQEVDSNYNAEPARAKEMIYQAIRTSKEYGFKREQAEGYFRLGNIQLNIGERDSASLCFEQAMQMYEQAQEMKGVSLCLKSLGNFYLETGNNEKSLDHYTKGLALAKQNQWNELSSSFIHNIGIIYLNQEHYEVALEHFEESASMNIKGSSYAIAINNIGVVKKKQGKFEEAITFFQKSLGACQEIGDEYCSLTPLGALASTYLELADLNLALEATEKIIKVQEKLGLDQDLMVSHNRMGLIYNQKEEYDLAVWYYHKSLKKARELHSGHTPYIYANLSKALANNGQFEEALENSIIFYEMRDSIYSQEHKIRTEELLTRYETEKRKKEIALLRKDQKLKENELEKKQALYNRELLKNELEEQENKYKMLEKNREIGFLKKDTEIQKARIENNQQELERQTFIRNIAIICAILIFLPTFVLMVVYQQKVRNKELLALKTEEVNKQQTLELLRAYEIKTIRASIEGQEKEKQRLAKELHDGVAGTLAGIKMRFQALEMSREENKQLQDLVRSVDDVYREVRTISHHLTPPGMLQYSFVAFIKKYLNEISQGSDFEMEYIFYGEKGLNQLNDDVKVELYRILQELISNIIKHAKADFVEVQLIKDGKQVTLIVEDRGKGFDMQLKSAGLGLNSIKSRVDALGGERYIDSLPGRGTLVNVEIPVL